MYSRIKLNFFKFLLFHVSDVPNKVYISNIDVLKYKLILKDLHKYKPKTIHRKSCYNQYFVILHMQIRRPFSKSFCKLGAIPRGQGFNTKCKYNPIELHDFG